MDSEHLGHKIMSFIERCPLLEFPLILYIQWNLTNPKPC